MPLTANAALAKDRTNARGTTMEHRHFATIAAIIAGLPDGGDDYAGDIRGETAAHFAAELAATNPRFDRARFLRACGVI